MKTKSATKQRTQARKGWTINDDMKSDYDIIMLDDMAGIDEDVFAECLEMEDDE
jgi:hypothetical protein